MSSMNSIVLVGRITKDPELRKTQNNKPVVSFTLAVNRKYKQEGQPEADFINCVAWNAQADFLAAYIAKGNLLGVEGRIQTRNYEDSTSKRVYVTEVVCNSVQALESRSQRAGVESAAQPLETHYPDYSQFEDGGQILNIDSDDLPF